MADDRVEGTAIVRASWCGTAVFVVTAVAADAVETLRAVAFVVSVALFVAGCVTFIVALVRGANRSRTRNVGVMGLFFLSGSAPPGVRRSLLGSVVVEVVAAFVTAGIRPYTSLAAGTLVPIYGLGLCGLWAAEHGSFDPR